MLPPLRHLEVEGPLEGLLPAWLRKPQAAARLTTLRLTHGAALHLRLLSLASGLRELTLEQSYLGAGMVHPGIMPLPLGLTTLTRLVVWDCYMAAVPPGVCHFTTLRHLSLGTEYGKLRGGLPSSMSSLQQLQRLDLRGRHLIELPADLGTWLPQLEELDVCGTSVSDLPRSLTRLTRLAASGTRVTQVSAVAHLVTLKELCMESSVLRPPLQPLAQLSALERLQLGWSKRLPEEMAAQLHLPTPLPALCSLAVRGPLLVDQVQEVVVGAQQLTRLALTINLGPEEVAALGQLGVLPRLKRLELSRVAGATQWAAAAPWLQQQPCLTSLKLSKGEAEGSLLPQLPAQLEELHIHPYVCVEGSVQGVEQPTALTQLSRLRKLSITCHDNQVVPSWLSSLRSLEVLEVTGWKVYHGWEVLAQLPLLRQVRVEEQSLVHALRHAPHLCWALPVVDN
jgi:Leucine-rich repeat (LRR) protein